jgi:hypothetical protein
MEHKFPNAVSVRYGLGGGCSGVYVCQQLQQRGTMPGLAVKRAAKLFGNQSRFGG